MKIALIGNTKQTKIGLERLVEEGYEVTHVFGLPEDKASNKVNFVSLNRNTSDMILFELSELMCNKLFHLTQKVWQLVSPQTNFHNNFAKLSSISL